MTLEEAIKHCEEVAEKNEEESNNWTYGASRINNDESRRKQYLKYAEMWHECANEHRQLAEWLKELKKYRRVRTILSQNRIATDRYGEVVLWDDIKRVLEEVNDD